MTSLRFTSTVIFFTCLAGSAGVSAADTDGSEIVMLSKQLLDDLSALCAANEAPKPKLAKYVEGYAVDRCGFEFGLCAQPLHGGYKFVEFKVGADETNDDSIFLPSMSNSVELPTGSYRIEIAKRPDKGCDAYDVLTAKGRPAAFNPLKDKECVSIRGVPRISAEFATRYLLDRRTDGDISSTIARDQIISLSSGEVVGEQSSIMFSKQKAWSFNCKTTNQKLTTEVIPPKILEPIRSR